MALRKTKLITNEYYHLYNRGNNKQLIFLDHHDYDRFVKLLYVCNSEVNFKFRNILEKEINVFEFERGDTIVEILAWVLMPNHFHIVLISHRSDLCEDKYNPISEFMRKLSTAYVMYFNKKYGKSGSLFEGKFKSSHIDQESYFNYIFAYVHLNPIKLFQRDWKERGITNISKTTEYLMKFRYSSFLDYYNQEKRKESLIINHQSLPDNFSYNHSKELFEWISTQVGPV